MTPQAAYDELIKKCKEISVLGSAASILHWDQETYMPKNGVGHRSEQIGLIARMCHEQFVDPKIGELISAAEDSDLTKDPESEAAANLREIRHAYDKETKLPKDLVEALAKTTAQATPAWAEARKKSDFSEFLPWFEKVLDLTLQKAEAFGYEGEPYNALLDIYEPGATVEQVETAFDGLRKELVPLVQAIADARKRPDESIVTRSFDVDKQKIFGESVAAAMGYDFNAGRLDITTHPFCTGIGPGDTRILTRYNPNRLNDALFGTMHEAGHALYEMGLEKEKHFGTPMGESVSLGIHESQSRMWENQVGRSKDFWVYFLPQAQRIFRESLGDVSLDDFYGAINTVKPSYIRVEADEATYNLHIMLRFELERAMTKKEIKPKDMAGEWNKRFKEYLGIEVDKDANGVLQDVHWSSGLIGYFPTYALGNLYAAQFFAQAKKDLPGLQEDFQHGNFSRLLDWLRKNIHHHGQRYRANVLCEKVTGEPLSHKPLMDYMKAKYGEIYGI
ncbi:carboxypeptidase M32 [candidate division GN15 bacterium]|nr:carboxypeptidase M32 [candidate division GN15 bacterium]